MALPQISWYPINYIIDEVSHGAGPCPVMQSLVVSELGYSLPLFCFIVL